jgi:hypothetical protein
VESVAMTVPSMTADDLTRLILPRCPEIDAVLRNPLRPACKNAVRMLGERLHELGLDLDQMQGVAERVSAGKAFQKRIDIIDKAWDGVDASDRSRRPARRSASHAKPCCSVSSAASSTPSMSCAASKKDSVSKR